MNRSTAITAVFLWLLAGSAFAAEDPALVRLNASPRHQEWVKVTHGKRVVETFVVYPEVSKKAPVVILIHENRGLTNWVRGVADELAEQGYIAVAPDLLSGAGPNGGKTSDFPSTNAARDAIYELPGDQVHADLAAVVDYAKTIPSANGEIAVAGFCWGGSRAFHLATTRADLAAAFVFYGTAPDVKAMSAIHCPVYGFYGGRDERVTSTIAATKAKMLAAGKTYDPVTYDGAGHGFMRTGEDGTGNAADKKARDAAWKRLLALLGKI